MYCVFYKQKKKNNKCGLFPAVFFLLVNILNHLDRNYQFIEINVEITNTYLEFNQNFNTDKADIFRDMLMFKID